MITTAIGVFALAAILGMIVLSFVLRDKPTPKAAVFGHGALAVLGVILLIIYATGHDPRPIESMVLFSVAASGGFIMVARDLMNKPIPKWLAVIHGIIALVAFIFLVLFQIP